MKSKFLRALETSQRNVKEIKEGDAALVNDVDVAFEDVMDGIDQRALELTASISDFVKDREAVDLFSTSLFDVSYIEKLPRQVNVRRLKQNRIARMHTSERYPINYRLFSHNKRFKPKEDITCPKSKTWESGALREEISQERFLKIYKLYLLFFSSTEALPRLMKHGCLSRAILGHFYSVVPMWELMSFMKIERICGS